MFMKNKKGIVGVGMLLIFIASIVASAIAAAVLISSTNVIQDRAIQVQTDALEGLVSGIEIASLYAEGDTENQTITGFEFIIRPRAGSRPIQLETMGLIFISGNITSTAYINSTLSGDNCTFNALSSQSEFCIDKVFGEDNTVLESGDLIRLLFKLDEGNHLGTEVPFDVIFQLRIGSPLSMVLRTPDMILSSKIRMS